MTCDKQLDLKVNIKELPPVELNVSGNVCVFKKAFSIYLIKGSTSASLGAARSKIPLSSRCLGLVRGRSPIKQLKCKGHVEQLHGGLAEG